MRFRQNEGEDDENLAVYSRRRLDETKTLTKIDSYKPTTKTKPLFQWFQPGPPGIPVREFPGILRKLRSIIFFLLFHYLSSFITIYNKH